MLDILNSTQFLSKLVEEELPGKTSLQLMRNIKKINEEIEIFEKGSKKLLVKYGEKVKDKPDDYLEIPQEKKDVFLKEQNEMLQQEVEIDVLLVDVETLGKKSPKDLFSIDFMLE